MATRILFLAALGLYHVATASVAVIGPQPLPLRLNVDTLHGDAALQRGAYVIVEVLNADGAVIPGYERDKCLVVDVNSLDHLLQWKEPGTTGPDQLITWSQKRRNTSSPLNDWSSVGTTN